MLNLAIKFRGPAVVTALLMLAGCGDAKPAPTADEFGSIGLELQIAPDVHLNSISYDITGNGFTKSGSLNVSSSTIISGRIGGIPAGTGYLITLTAVDAGAAGISCQGAVPFNITAGMTTTALVRMQCRLPAPRTGSVLIAGTVNICPRLDSISIEPSETTVGHSVVLTGSATDADRVPSPVAYAWTSSAGAIAGATAPVASFTCAAAGTVTVTLTVSDGDCTDAASATVICSPGPAPVVKINEIESNQGTPGDWVELVNVGTGSADVSGWIFRDNDDTHLYRIPAATVIAPGGYLLLEEAAFGFGLGAADSARLFDAAGVAVIDSYAWTAHAATTYGRCPNGTGDFAPSVSSTKGAPNNCGGGTGGGGAGGTGGAVGTGGAGTGGAGTGGATATGGAGTGGAMSTGGAGGALASAWPGADSVVTVDAANTFGANLSGLTYQAATPASAAVLWAVQNNPSRLFRLMWDGAVWSPASDDDWATGKTLRYTTSLGSPDSEGVTLPDPQAAIAYVATERDNDNSGVSRLGVLRFDAGGAGAVLTATHDWNLTSDLPAVGANLGLEAITWVPDSYLVAKGFIDERTAQPYQPALYPNHGGGLFFVGLEANGVIYAYALDHAAGGFQRVATIPSGHTGVMDIHFDAEVGYLWAKCDNTCGNRTSVLDIVTDVASSQRGRFQLRGLFARPASLADVNHEGMAIAPESECANNRKNIFWSDDGQTDGHALRRDSVPCGRFL